MLKIALLMQLVRSNTNLLIIIRNIKSESLCPQTLCINPQTKYLGCPSYNKNQLSSKTFERKKMPYRCSAPSITFDIQNWTVAPLYRCTTKGQPFWGYIQQKVNFLSKIQKRWIFSKPRNPRLFCKIYT